MFKLHKNNKFPIISIALFVFIFCSCAQNPSPKETSSTIHASSEITSEMTITKEQAIEDYEQMWDIIEENFTALDSIAISKDIDVPELQKTFYARLENGNDVISIRSFQSTLGQSLKYFGGLGHLRILSVEEYFSRIDTFENFDSFQAHFISERLHYPRSIEVYGSLLQESEVSNNSNNNNNTDKKPANVSFKDNIPEVAYIKIDQFITKHQEETLILENWFKANVNKPYVIIDIRKNGGGNDLYWMENIIAPNISETTQCISFVSSNTGLDFEEYTKPHIANPNYAQLATEDEIKKLNLPDHAKDKMLIKIHHSTINPKYEKPILTGKIFVLTGNTGSSVDGFANFCKQTGFATLLGKTTKGDGIGIGSPITSPLKNSGLQLLYRPVEGINPDGTSNIVDGTIPDLDSGNEDTLEFCMKYIENLDK